jgi:hypothetical protein
MGAKCDTDEGQMGAGAATGSEHVRVERIFFFLDEWAGKVAGEHFHYYFT